MDELYAVWCRVSQGDNRWYKEEDNLTMQRAIILQSLLRHQPGYSSVAIFLHGVDPNKLQTEGKHFA